MSKTALYRALDEFDLPALQKILAAKPELRELRTEKGFDLLQYCCKRRTDHDPAAAARQVQVAKWLVSQTFDPRELLTTAPGEDGEEEPSQISLVWFAVAKAQNNKLARFFLDQGASPEALFAAAWWGNADILEDLVTHGADIDEHVGATPLHMAVDVLYRGVEGKPDRARRRLRTLQEFLRLGANPNIPAVNGETPLHSVLRKDYPVEVFKLLLKHGANPDLPGKDSRTVRDIALRKRDKHYANAL